MVKTLSLEKAKKELPDIVEKLQSGDFVVVQKNGRPVAGIVDVDDMENFLELQNSVMKRQIAKGYREFKARKTVSARSFLQLLRRVK